MWAAILIPVFSLINIALAKWDASIFAKKKTVSHGFNGALYIALLVPVWFITHNWYLIGALLFDRLLFFNIPLNRMRGLDWNYRPIKPASAVDWIGNLIPSATWMYIIYGALFITLTILSCT